MTYIEDAIKEAVAQGYERKSGSGKLFAELCAQLDPLFWQALGKARGWKGLGIWKSPEEKELQQWEMEWHRFIDHLIAGKDAESFFKNL